ncbi:MAG: hypothetical protein VKJ04_06460 [Vampirovibrionales bacterium]|nr:hypothetical protein [Vampirovibrionales bacterium]
MLKKSFFQGQGQSMSEMGIVLALISVTGIVGLTTMGDVLQGGFSSHNDSLKNNELANLQAQDAQGLIAAASNAPLIEPDTPIPIDSGSANNTAAASPTAAPEGSSLGLTLGNGQYLDLSDYPVDVGQAIETAGANGTTNMLLATLESVIQQAIASGAVTPDGGNQLKALARQGHNIANIQAQVENAILKQKDFELSREISWEIGYNPGNKTEGPQITEFRSLLKDAQSNGSIKDPLLNQIITTLVNQIINISSGVENASHWVGETNDFSAAYFYSTTFDEMYERDELTGSNTKQTLLDIGASALSHQNANAICQAGQVGDNCQP